MSKKIQLSIPKPCHEDWDKMSPEDKGRFCASCSKTVMDFSSMSDRELAEFFKRPALRRAQGSVCGRFTNEQLNRDIEIPRKRIPWLKYFFQFALPAFFVSLRASAEKTQGKLKITQTSKDTLTPLHQEFYMLGTIAAGKCVKAVVPQKKEIKKQIIKGDTIVLPGVRVYSLPLMRQSCGLNENIVKPIIINPPSMILNEFIGRVVDDTGDPVPGVSVRIKGTRIGTLGDENGQFKINAKINDTLTVESVGFEANEYPIKENKIGTIYLVPLIHQAYMGLIVTTKHTKCVNTIKNKPDSLAAKKELKKDDVLLNRASAFKLYPNPVNTGNSINLVVENLEEGYYVLQYFSQNGQMFNESELWIDKEARILDTMVPNLAKGEYLIVLTSKKTDKKFSEKIVIQ